MHRSHVVMCLLLGLGGILLVAVAGVPFGNLLPIVLVGGCLLMHLLMPHGGRHGGHGDGSADTTATTSRKKE
jgi:hypothetical protein